MVPVGITETGLACTAAEVCDEWCADIIIATARTEEKIQVRTTGRLVIMNLGATMVPEYFRRPLGEVENVEAVRPTPGVSACPQVLRPEPRPGNLIALQVA